MRTSLGYHEYIGGYHDECEGYHEYIMECSVYWRDTMRTSEGYQSTSWGYHEYIGKCSVHREDARMHVEEKLH